MHDISAKCVIKEGNKHGANFQNFEKEGSLMLEVSAGDWWTGSPWWGSTTCARWRACVQRSAAELGGNPPQLASWPEHFWPSLVWRLPPWSLCHPIAPASKQSLSEAQANDFEKDTNCMNKIQTRKKKHWSWFKFPYYVKVCFLKIIFYSCLCSQLVSRVLPLFVFAPGSALTHNLGDQPFVMSERVLISGLHLRQVSKQQSSSLLLLSPGV